MKVFLAVVSCLIISVGAYYFLGKYQSAFEADQACHAEKWSNYADNSSFGCDHDLETKQWLIKARGGL